MPLIHKIQCDSGCVLGFWEISETKEEVMSLLTLDQRELEAMDNFRNESRKLQWLCTRALLKCISNSEKKIVYNDNGKPFLLDASNNISISHSGNMVGIILNRTNEVGLDLEIMCGRVSKVANRFLNETERENIDKRNKNHHLYAYWCAKETLYKVFGETEIPFDKNIIIDPFVLQENGSFTGTIKNEQRTEKYQLKYFTLNNYMVVYTKKEINGIQSDI